VPLWIGTSGWQYSDWRGRFYPPGVAQRSWLEHYSANFATVEVNNAFYRLPAHETFVQWRERTPEGFVVAVKASRYLTHIKRLREPAEPVSRLLERAVGLGERLGPVLLQLPPNLQADLGLLAETLSCFPPSIKVAVEPRHDSWYTDALHQLLAEHGAAFCLADTPARRSPLWRTTEWGYVRFHEGRASPLPCYGKRALETWAARLAELWPPEADVYAYFNNDPLGCAPRDAVRFAAAGAKAGLVPTRVPSPKSVPAG
jgi:uncharacterized protein YecE (DUF72 family)